MERRIIDFHTHAFPDKIAQKTITYLAQKAGIPPYSDGTFGGLCHVLADAGVTTGVVLPVVTKSEQFASILSFAKAINEENKTETKGIKMISFAGIHPDSADYKNELNQIKREGFLGIKIHPDYQGVYFDDLRFMRIMEYATELGLCMVTHAGVDIGIKEPVRCTPDRVLRVLREVRPKKLVLAHMGGHDLFAEVLQKLSGEDVYFDTAFSLNKMAPDLFIKMCRTHGTDKILFATDCPWGDPSEFVNYFCGLSMTEEEKEQILHENAEKLLGPA